jgi:hypothetical protein
MADWSRKTAGLDWPGFSTEELKRDIGGSNSYLVAGGFYITALDDTGAVRGWDNFATHGTDVGWSGDNFRYLVRQHRKRWPDGANYHLATDPFEAEEVIDTVWEMNGAWYQPWDNQNIPVAVRRTVRQWSGSRADEDYVIIDYTLRNMQRRDALQGVYLLFTWALSPNHRGWNLTFPNFPAGARNTVGSWDPDEQLLLTRAGDYTPTLAVDESFDYFVHSEYDPVTQERKQIPEYLAPGVMGIKFLYISPDSSGRKNRINGFTWAAASPSQDHFGPFLGVSGLDNKYRAMADPSQLSEAFTDPSDPRMGKNRLYACFSLGPFNIPRRDSIQITMAEFVGGAPFRTVRDTDLTPDAVRAAADSAADYLNDRIDFTWSHDYTVPMPPPGPDFTVSADQTGGRVGNVIRFDDRVETVPDPHQGSPDIAGYRIYRSGYLPFGPWEQIADIPVGHDEFYDTGTGEYTFTDTRVALGYGYYYAVTSYDNGHSQWSVDPSVSVPPLESSVFANRSQKAFITTLTPAESALDRVTVVPNPFYRHSGLTRLGDEKVIQFVNVPRECTINIFTLRGDLVKTIHHNDPQSGVAVWNQISDYGQYVKSGLYFYHITNAQGQHVNGKFTIIN